MMANCDFHLDICNRALYESAGWALSGRGQPGIRFDSEALLITDSDLGTLHQANVHIFGVRAYVPI